MRLTLLTKRGLLEDALKRRGMPCAVLFAGSAQDPVFGPRWLEARGHRWPEPGTEPEYIVVGCQTAAEALDVLRTVHKSDCYAAAFDGVEFIDEN